MNAKAEVQRNMPRNFVDHLRTLAAERPKDIALVVTNERDGAHVDTSITYDQLDARVRALAAQLQQKFELEDRVLLLLDNNDHYVVAFFACFYAGLIAVPVFPPESTREQHMTRLRMIARDSRASCILTSSDVLASAGPVINRFNDADVIAVDTVGGTNADRWMPKSPTEDAIAFLQYTSGSTSAPKGVMVSHGNLMANERAIEHALSITEDDVFVSWLPLFHDMGLIGGLLQPIHRGIKLVLMTPKFFLERPARWLEAISRHRGTISGGPDFSYCLCLERIKDTQLADLNLSSWRVAFSGAEPVRHDTLNAFTARFSEVGFPAVAVNPCYGLAEATLMVTAGQPGVGIIATAFQDKGLQCGEILPDPEGRTLVACGKVVAGHQVSIRDTQAQAPCADGTVGDIWASGPSVAKGYWNKPKETAETFVERDRTTWLRTGDLGFIYEGQLYVTGRVKDLIIVRGHNIYPQDIERTIESEVDAVRKGRVAAFAIEGPDGEGIGIAAEVSRSLQKRVLVDKLVESLGVAVSELCGEPLSVAVLLNPGALPKTSSGKLQRRACRQGWLDQTLDAYAIYEHDRFMLGGGEVVAATAPGLDDVETELAKIWTAALGDRAAKKFDRRTHFFAAGGNSLAAARAAADIEARWKVAFSVRLLFEYPRLAECAAELRLRLADGSEAVAEPIPVLPADQRNRPLPLSSAQQRQWFLWKLDPTSTAYHIQGALRLTGEINRKALTAAVTGLAQRHESLRTVFSESSDGEITQYIEPQGELPLRVIDLAGADQKQLQETLQQFNTEPFDLTRGPLARMALICLAEDLHILAMVIHHIIADGVSMQILVDELATRYTAAVANRESDLLTLPVQYVDYAQWQRQWLDRGEREHQLGYWRWQLGDHHQPLLLSTDHPRRAVAHYRAGQHDLQLPDTLSAKLRELAENTGGTLFTVLLATFQTLLYRYTGQTDIRVGTPVANRARAETQGIIGFFVNTLVLRNNVRGQMLLAQVLQQARQATLEALAHQELPFEELVDALQPERSLSHNPLFQVMFNYLREDYRILQGLPGLTVTSEPFVAIEAQFELALDVREDAQGTVSLHFTYAGELFEPETIARMAEHYRGILAVFAAQPDCSVADIEFLSKPERQQLEQWGTNTCGDYPTMPVHRLFERRVEQQPEAIALLFNGERLTYAELNGRANKLAHHLIGLGVKPETRVGIAVERSIYMVVGLLAILKAGGAYVPLDPEYPAERLAYIAEDSGIELLLTQNTVRNHLTEADSLAAIALESVDLDACPHHNPRVPVHGNHVAYVIYTSGSTGKPKGAANLHGALSNCMAWMQEAYVLQVTDTVLHKAPFGFDVSVWELFWPLTAGARLAVAGPGEHRDPARIIELIRRHKVTTLNFVPAMLQAFLEREEAQHQTYLKHVICGGEAMSAAVQQRALTRLGSATLQNLYGPTEAAIHVTRWTCRDDGCSQVPIGRPIAGIYTRVLDTDLNPVPQGVVGELYLGGVGLARGYVNRLALTAERFVADPCSDSGERLYRTGDLVRWNGEGQLDYLGRIDHQVKIRGFRIEPGEVEAQLRAQPDVAEAVVVARETAAGPCLVAYVCPCPQRVIDSAALRRRLGETLLDYMVPGSVVVLETLPLGPNGKVDRGMLPAPNVDSGRIYADPRGSIETALAALWREVLGVERIGRSDSFFDLGGNSLSVLKVNSLLARRHGCELPVRTFFEARTVAALAGLLPADRFSQPDVKAERLSEMDRLLKEFEV